MVSNKCHKRERQVNESHALGSDNFNSAEEVHVNIHVCVCAVRATVKVTCHAIYLSILIINLIKCRCLVAPHLPANGSETAEEVFLLIVTLTHNSVAYVHQKPFTHVRGKRRRRSNHLRRRQLVIQ